MDIIKVKIKGDETEIVYNDNPNVKTTQNTFLKSEDTRSQKFTDSMAALTRHLQSVVSLPAKYLDTVIVSGVSFRDHETKGMGAVISAQKKLSHCSSPFNMSTPLMWEGSEGQNDAVFDQNTLELLQAIREEAEAFVNGARAQQDLFDEDEEELADSVNEADAEAA